MIFAHSSCKDGKINQLLNAIAGNSTKMHGEQIFRAMSGFKRLRFQNVGLNKDKKKLRYIMYTGTDTQEAIPLLDTTQARKSNLFGKGFENGVESTIGCSHKGRVWAMDSSGVDKWVDWCDKIGNKISDSSIDTNDCLKTAVKSEILIKFPDVALIDIDWPLELLRKNEDSITWEFLGKSYSFLESDIQLTVGVTKGNKLNFSITLGDTVVDATLILKEKDEYQIEFSKSLHIIIGNSKISASDFFNENPPLIFLSDTSTIEGNLRFYCDTSYFQSYNKHSIQEWDWEGVDLSVESQTETKINYSIQYYTINKIRDSYDFIFDDDGTHEIADIIAIKNNNNEELIIDLYHCKYCSKNNGVAKPGARVGDIYEVFGQAIKSTRWARDNDKIFERLAARERKRLGAESPTRIEKGNFAELIKLQKISRLARSRHNFYIVQPGISKKLVSNEQLSLLGAAATYIMETTGAKLEVIASP